MSHLPAFLFRIVSDFICAEVIPAKSFQITGNFSSRDIDLLIPFQSSPVKRPSRSPVLLIPDSPDIIIRIRSADFISKPQKLTHLPDWAAILVKNNARLVFPTDGREAIMLRFVFLHPPVALSSVFIPVGIPGDLPSLASRQSVSIF